MTVFVGFLRGINVGGKNKIKMAELKKMLESTGLAQVQTYLQTGNILFQSDQSAEALREQIEQAIHEQFGMSLTVVLRTAEQMKKVLAVCPYEVEKLTEGQTIQISVLTEAPDQKMADILSKDISERDEFQLQGCEIYFLFRQSVLDSKLAANLQKLGGRVTTRNWNTMQKLSELASAML
ncbi:DUF1697 domain-containing protein [Paenibacillus guangzhouensis]|uniref:DUF1697 domain-containing protein n=1 Tax=Paenibacillus guangzhouensis TaxID=1473112 RepID=UPI001266FB66|nr:DUF1697 domain-containing protein [Paenibacillus guangzhouensis]